MTDTMDRRAIAYQKPQPTGMLADMLQPGALDLDAAPETWVPQAEDVWFRPLLLSVSSGYYINLLRVRKAGILSRHRHLGPVHAFTLRGEWHYLEHDWTARPGDYAFEPSGETHTLIVPEGVEEMVTLFHVTAGYVYVDPEGKAMGYEDVFTKLDATLAHYEKTGLGRAAAEALVR